LSLVRREIELTFLSRITIYFASLIHKVVRHEKQAIHMQRKRMVDGGDSNSMDSRSPSIDLPSVAPPTQDFRVPFDFLVRSAISDKRNGPPDHALVVEVPDDAHLTYYIYAKDNPTGRDLGKPVIYHHTNKDLANGAFSYLKTSFERAGFSPIVAMHTANGRRIIRSEEDWDSAVRTIYFWRPHGGIVEVDMLV
jgi:hypothetical protein